MTNPASPPTILFLCTGNSCRSQMAEGFSKALKADRIIARSAGVAPSVLDQRAVKVMAEAGVDISAQRAKSVEQLDLTEFDYVITLCDNARETCPFFPARTKLIHAGFADPPHLARGAASEEEALGHYRRVRDQIRDFVSGLPENLA